MSDDLFGVPSRALRKPDIVQPYQKPPTARAWTHCQHDPPCPNAVWCASGCRDVRDLQQAKGYTVEDAIRRVKLGERA